MSMSNCFYIYSDKNPEVTETIESAIERINATQVVNVDSIKRSRNSNLTEMRALLTAIDKSNLILCDLTVLDINLLFVLGYAIAKNKMLWFSLNSSFPDSERNLKRLSLLGGLQHEIYENSIMLMTKFLQGAPYQDSGPTFNDEIMHSMVMTKGKTLSLLYLKCELQTDASIHLTRRLKDTTIPMIVDDPLEVASQPLTWYAENLYNSYAVVAHFIDENRQLKTTFLQNEKYALICGLAYGYEKNILILAHQTFDSYLTQMGFLFSHSTAAECIRLVNNWLPSIEGIYQQQQKEFARHKSELDTAVGLQRISLGEILAEQEETELAHYFVNTAAYKNALKASKYIIFVGRKGSGKTANLQQLNSEISKDKRNHVSLITPADYELEGVLELLNANFSKADAGYLLQSLWKYLVYTELARSVYLSLKKRPLHVGFEPVEKEFVDYIDKQKDLQEDFTVRMEYAIQELCKLDEAHNIREQRVKVSEILHSELLSQLQSRLGEVLAEKNKVYVLVDNLDKAWKNRNDIELLSDFLFGLLSAGEMLASQLQTGGLRRKGINFVLIVYLRSDIFDYIHYIAREKDKLSSELMDWNDPELLKNVIEKRFVHSIGEQISSEEIWNEYFVPSVKGGMPTSDYILGRIIPRPRDIIYFCREALNQAINHKHSRIEEIDILKAEKVYSNFAVDSLLDETKTQLPEIMDLLFEFVGCKDVISKFDLEKYIKSANIPEEKMDYAIELLCETTFLGVETKPGYFEFLYDSNKARVLKRQAQKLAQEHGEYRYKINIESPEKRVKIFDRTTKTKGSGYGVALLHSKNTQNP